ncbi:hypothetical protein JCM5350_003042 [Sporobolomyces pararoseus]
MCIAEATLVYGLTVRSADLVFAADAFTRLRQTLPFFGFVLLRRRSGGLSSSLRAGRGVVPITEVPDDLWERIRHCLIREEIAESEDTLIGRLLCDDPTCQVRPPPSQRMTWERMYEMRFDICHRCEGAFDQFAMGEIKDWEEPILSNIVKLLSAFDLALPSHTSLPTKKRWYESGDYTASALIAAPSVFETGKSDEALINTEPSVDDYVGHTIVDISTANLPLDIDQRFERLIKLFSLEIVDTTIDKIAPRLNGSAVTPSRGKASRGETNEEVTSKIKPGWKVHLVCKLRKRLASYPQRQATINSRRNDKVESGLALPPLTSTYSSSQNSKTDLEQAHE